MGMIPKPKGTPICFSLFACRVGSAGHGSNLMRWPLADSFDTNNLVSLYTSYDMAEHSTRKKKMLAFTALQGPLECMSLRTGPGEVVTTVVVLPVLLTDTILKRRIERLVFILWQHFIIVSPLLNSHQAICPGDTVRKGGVVWKKHIVRRLREASYGTLRATF